MSYELVGHVLVALPGLTTLSVRRGGTNGHSGKACNLAGGARKNLESPCATVSLLAAHKVQKKNESMRTNGSESERKKKERKRDKEREKE